MIFVGDDWAEAHHDVCVLDEQGGGWEAAGAEGLAGIGQLHALLAEHAERAGRGRDRDRDRSRLWVAALLEAGYRVYAINPLAASRYRDRHAVSGAKSDPGRRAGAGRSGAHRPPPAPRGGGRQRAGRGRQGARACPSGPDLDAPAAGQPAALDAARVLPAGARGVRRRARRAATHSPCWHAHRAPTEGRLLSLAALRCDAQARWPAAQSRSPSAARSKPRYAAPSSPQPADHSAFAASVRATRRRQHRAHRGRSPSSSASSPMPSCITRTPRSCAVCPDSASSSAPGYLASSATTPNRYKDAKAPPLLRRHRPHHQGLRHPPRRARPRRPQPPARRRLLPLGLRRAHPLTRRPRALRPPTRTRSNPPPSPPSPRQPARRHPPRLPATPHPLRRNDRLGTHPPAAA